MTEIEWEYREDLNATPTYTDIHSYWIAIADPTGCSDRIVVKAYFVEGRQTYRGYGRTKVPVIEPWINAVTRETYRPAEIIAWSVCEPLPSIPR